MSGDPAFVMRHCRSTSPEIHYCLQQATGCHVTRAPDYIDEELYDKLVAMKGGKAREDYLADHDVPLFRCDLLACIAKPGWFED